MSSRDKNTCCARCDVLSDEVFGFDFADPAGTLRRIYLCPVCVHAAVLRLLARLPLEESREWLRRFLRGNPSDL